MSLILTHTAFEAALALHEASSEAIEAVLALSRGYLQLKNHRSDLRLVLSFLDTALRLGRKEEALRVARNSLRVLEKMGPDAERYRPCLLLRLIKGLLGGERTVRSESVCMWSEEDVKTALVEMVTGMGTKDDAQLERKMQYLLHKESDLLKATEYAEARGFPSPRFLRRLVLRVHVAGLAVDAAQLPPRLGLASARVFSHGFLPAVSFVGRTLRRDDSKHFTVARESHGVRVARDEAGSSLPPLPSPLHRCERPLLHLHSLVADPPQGSAAGRSRGGAARLSRLRALPHPPHAARPAERLRGRTGAERV